MKRIVLFLSILFLTLLFIFPSLAALSDSDCLFIYKFDSGDAVSKVTFENPFMTVKFDASNNSLKAITRPYKDGTPGTADNYFNLNLPQSVKIAEYPYLRIKYRIPSTLEDGTKSSASGTINTYYPTSQIAADKGGRGGGLMEIFGVMTADDKWHYQIIDLAAAAAKTSVTVLNDLRMDIPNNIPAGYHAECLISEIGAFKTEMAAKVYGNQGFLMNGDSMDEGAKWSCVQSTMTSVVDAEIGGSLKFLHEQASHADARVTRVMADSERFMSGDYPYFAYKYKTNYKGGSSGHLWLQLNAPAYVNFTDNPPQLKPDGSWANYFGGAQSPFGYTLRDETWGLGMHDMNGTAHYDPKAAPYIKLSRDFPVTAISQDTLNVQSSPGTDYVMFKYFVFLKTAEEAALEQQLPPLGLTVSTPSSAVPTGTISGVTSAMEYKLSTDTNYTACTGTTITGLAPGKTYYVRYSAKTGFNKGFDAKISVPEYIELNIKHFIDKFGKQIAIFDKVVDHASGTIHLKMANTVDLTQLKPVFDFKSSSSITQTLNGITFNKSVGLYTTLNNYSQGSVIESGVTEWNLEAAKGSGISAVASIEGSVQKKYTITCESVALTDAQKVAHAINLLDALTFEPSDTTNLVSQPQIESVINAKIATLGFDSYIGVTTQISFTNLTACELSSAKNRDGKPGSASYKFTVTSGLESATSPLPNTVVIHVTPYRVVWKFNNQEFINQMSVNTGGSLVTKNGKVPLIIDNNSRYMQAKTISTTSAPNIYLEYGNVGLNKADIAAGNYKVLVDLDKYKYMKVKYKSSGDFPDAAGSAWHLYYGTDYFIMNNNFVQKTGPLVGTGSYAGYAYTKDSGFYSINKTAILPNQSTFTTKVIDFTSANADYTRSGITWVGNNPDTGLVINGNKEFPWKGKLTYFRFDILKGKVAPAAGSTFDIDYIAFFPTAEEAAAYDGSTFGVIPQQAVTDMQTGTSSAKISALKYNTEEKAKAQVTAIIQNTYDTAIKGKYKGLLGNDLGYEYYIGNYTAPSGNLPGSVAVDIYLYDGDETEKTYSSKITSVISIDSSAEVETIKQRIISDKDNLAYAYTASDPASADAAITARLKQIIWDYSDLTYTVSGSNYIAATPGTASQFYGTDGSYKCSITFSQNGYSGTITDLSIKVNAKKYPAIYKFNNQAFINKWGGSIDIDNLTGNSGELITYNGAINVAKFVKAAGSEISLSMNISSEGDLKTFNLSDYPYFAIRYMSSNPVDGPTFQFYFTTPKFALCSPALTFSAKPSANTTWITDVKYAPSVSAVYGVTEKSTGDASWNNTLNAFRMDLMRYYSKGDKAVYLDYIAFFATEAEANAFAADQSAFTYGNLGALRETAASLANITCNQKVSNNSMSEGSAFELAKTTYISQLNSQVITPSFTFKSFTTPVPGTLENLNGTPGSIVMEVTLEEYLFRASATTTVIIPAMPYNATEPAGAMIGAQVRTEGIQGLRFCTRSYFNAFIPAEKTGGVGETSAVITDVTYGTLILPHSCFVQNSQPLTYLTHANMQNGQLFNKNVADVIGEKIYARRATYVDFTAVITQVPLNKYDMKFVARGYVKCKVNGVVTYYYFEPIVRSVNDVISSVGK